MKIGKDHLFIISYGLDSVEGSLMSFGGVRREGVEVEDETFQMGEEMVLF